jgi:predicted ATP-grasp superfamily ATP-dependent carboligase
MKTENFKTIFKPFKAPYAIVIGADCATGLQTARILHRHKVPVVGIAKSLNSPFCRTNVCRKILQADLGSADFIHMLRKIGPYLDQKAVLYPVTDMSVLILSRHRRELADWYHIALPAEDVIEMLIDKFKFYSFAMKEGFPIPKTYFLYNREDAEKAARKLTYPGMLKPPIKTPEWEKYTGIKVYKMHSPEELLEVYDRTCQWAEVLMVQDWIEGGDTALYTSNCYFSRKHEALVVFISQKLRQWPHDIGIGCLSIECRNDVVRDETIRLFSHVNYFGLGYLEMKHDEKRGKHYIIEPNIGRPTGRSANAEAGGVDLIYTMYCECVGWPLPENREQTYKGAKWIYLRRDLQSSVKHWRKRTLTIKEWWKSIRGVKGYAVFSWSDPLPFIEDFRLKFVDTIFRKNGKFAERPGTQPSNNGFSKGKLAPKTSEVKS